MKQQKKQRQNSTALLSYGIDDFADSEMIRKEMINSQFSILNDQFSIDPIDH